MVTVVSFAKDFEIRIPVAPDTWRINDHSGEPLSLAVAGEGKSYIRVANQGFQHFVDIETGIICNRAPGGTLACPKKWEIAVFDQAGNPHVVAAFER